MKTILVTILTAVLVSSNLVQASCTDTTNMPKIGLVLSGGAAKGMAHIGVLKVLEEMGITPDYITGTSMGAVVGGLYAAGYSAAEIEEMANRADWDFLLSDKIPLNKVAYEEKYEYDRFVFGVPIRDYRFRLPSGVIEGQQLEKLFAELMWPLDEDLDFDSLPIPFRCVGVDLLSGNIVVFDHGNLAESIRASMAIPSIFSPESIDSMLLVDGGTHRNFPVEEVKRMGADIVIGVYVGSEENVSKEDMFSLSDVISRSTVLTGIIDSKEQSKLVDISIEPDLQNLSAGDFNKSRQFIALGETAALAQQEALQHLADSLNLPVHMDNKPIKPLFIKVDSIEVLNERPFISDDFVIAKSGVKSGQNVSREDLSMAVDNIYGTQYFSKVTYSLEQQEDQGYKLIFKVKEKTRAYLNISANYNNQYGPGLVANLTLRNYLVQDSRTSVNLKIAEDPTINFEMNKYFGKKHRLLKYGFFDASRYENYLYHNGIDLGTYRVRAMKTGFGFKYSIIPNFQAGACLFYERKTIVPNANLKNYFGAETFDRYLHTGISYKLFYHINTLNDLYFPKSGLKLDVWYRYSYNTRVSYAIGQEDRELVNNVVYFRDSKKDFEMLYLNTQKYVSLLKKITLSAGVTAGISSEESVGVGNFIIGGLHNDRRDHYISFAGKNFAEDIVSNFTIISAGIDIEVLSDLYISGRADAGIFSNNRPAFINDFRNLKFDNQQRGYCVGVKANTILGPVSVMAGTNNMDHSLNWYINFGHSF